MTRPGPVPAAIPVHRHPNPKPSASERLLAAALEMFSRRGMGLGWVAYALLAG